MGLCAYEGRSVTPDMPGCCNGCQLYLNTCLPVIHGGYLTSAECDADYCGFCDYYGECSMYFRMDK